MTGLPDEQTGCTGFHWEVGKINESWGLRQASQAECEQAYCYRPLLVVPDQGRSQGGRRYAVLGQTAAGRRVAVIFTNRGSLLRVISARDMSRWERRVYEEANEVD